MRVSRIAMLAACVAALPLAIATGAKAADPSGNPPVRGVVLYNALGVPVAILTPLRPDSRAAATAATADPAQAMIRDIEAATGGDDAFLPFAQLMARQDQMMRQVMDQMTAVMAGADPFGRDGTIEAAVPAGPGAQRIVVSTFSSGHGSCSQTISYDYAGGSAAPVVSVRKVGDACGSIDAPGTRTIPAARESVPEQATPAVPAPSPAARTYRIDYRTPVRAPISQDQRG